VIDVRVKTGSVWWGESGEWTEWGCRNEEGSWFKFHR